METILEVLYLQATLDHELPEQCALIIHGFDHLLIISSLSTMAQPLILTSNWLWEHGGYQLDCVTKNKVNMDPHHDNLC